jgi:hypothetical protein
LLLLLLLLLAGILTTAMRLRYCPLGQWEGLPHERWTFLRSAPRAAPKDNIPAHALFS